MNNMKKRIFSILPLALPVALSAADTKRPNIVFIFSDDHAPAAISAYGESRKLIETPNIDRLATEGMRFDRCLVPNAICGPSRATVLTGKYSHKNGFYNNTSGIKFDGSQVTAPKLLQAAGYQAAIIGKWHLGSAPTGFDFWQVLINQGQYYNPPMICNGKKMEINGYVTDIITDASIDWLNHRNTSKPFLLMVHQKAPHREWEPALRDLDFDHGRTYDEPTTLFDDYAGRGSAEHDQKMQIDEAMNNKDLKLVEPKDLNPEQRKAWDAYYQPRNEAFKQQKLTGKALTSWKYQRYMHDYLACIRSVDDSVGSILKYLDDHGLTENTIVIYSSDQGFFLGEHGWFDKRWIFEESLRAPLLVRWPGVTQPGGVSRDIVSNLDFAETFLDAAGVPVPAEMQGRSLRPILAGNTPSDWRKSFLYDYYEYPVPHQVSPQYGVVTDRYKLVQFYGTGEDYTELFDLQNDPHEMTSVFGAPAYAKTQLELQGELARLRKELQVPDQTPATAFGKGKPSKSKTSGRKSDSDDE